MIFETSRSPWLVLFLASGALLSSVSAAPGDPPLQVSRATSEIKIDGVLDEPAWKNAANLPLKLEWFPGDQVPPPVETDCLIAYDDDNLYVAFRAYDPEPDKIRAHLMDRDSIQTFVQDDHVTLMVDTFNDQRRAFQFRVNPLGVQADAVFSEIDGIEDFSWDVIWNSAGKINDEGYVVEIALPFNQLRFKSGGGVQTWGIEVGRSYPRNVRHRISANARDRSDNCLLCQLDKITGFEGLKPGLNLVIAPTLTAQRTDTRPMFPTGSLESGEEDVEAGLSVRWGATPNITFNATINPDFSQVEADVAQLDVNERFALFFPEKRPFFLEGIDFFSTRIRTVFTRSVVNPEWGVKMTGKQGKNLLGVFAAQDRTNNLLLPANGCVPPPGPPAPPVPADYCQRSTFAPIDDDVLSGVVRYRRDLGESSTLGFIFAGRESTDYRNHVYGVDSLIRFNPKNDFTVQYLRSDTRYPDAFAMTNGQPLGSFEGDAFVLDWNRVTRNLVVSLELEDRESTFRADSGFVPRVDWRRALGVVRRNFWAEPGEWYSQLQVGVFASRTEDQSNQLTDELLDIFTNLRGPLQSYVEMEVQRERTFAGNTLFEDLDRTSVYAEIQPTGIAKFTAFVQIGDTVDFSNIQRADEVLVDASTELKLGRRFNVRLNHTLQDLDVTGGDLFKVNLSQLRLIYQFNTRMFVRSIFQYQDISRDPLLFSFPVNPSDETLLSQFLFSYKVNAQTVVFAGYSDNQIGTDMIDLTKLNQTFFVKLGYAWVR